MRLLFEEAILMKRLLHHYCSMDTHIYIETYTHLLGDMLMIHPSTDAHTLTIFYLLVFGWPTCTTWPINLTNILLIVTSSSTLLWPVYCIASISLDHWIHLYLFIFTSNGFYPLAYMYNRLLKSLNKAFLNVHLRWYFLACISFISSCEILSIYLYEKL